MPDQPRLGCRGDAQQIRLQRVVPATAFDDHELPADDGQLEYLAQPAGKLRPGISRTLEFVVRIGPLQPIGLTVRLHPRLLGWVGIGNAVGSNIANIALILGGAALLRPLSTVSNILTRELPLLIVLTALAVLLALDGDLQRLDGIALILALFGAMGLLLRQALAQREEADPLATELADQVPTGLPLRWALLWLAVGLVLLLVSSRMLVWGGVNIAETLGVSDLVIGLTIVAVGTSLPELAAAAASALKGEHDLVLGNVIGSNLFNTLAVLGLPALMRPGPIPPEVLTRDLPVMCALTLLLIPALAHRRGRTGRIGRVEGLLLVSCFIAYEGWLFATLK